MSFQKSTALTTAAQRAVVSIADAELILIVDCSSSMSPHVLPVYTGLNELLTMQGKLPGKTRITLVLFNDSPTIIYANARLTDTSTLAASTFRPEGATALYDAVGFAVESASERLNLMPFYQRPKVIVLVATDGAENASRAYTGTQVRSMIQLRRARDKWHFLLLSPNPKSVAKDLGIDPEDAQPWPENGAVLPMFSRIAGRVNQLRLTGGPAR